VDGRLDEPPYGLRPAHLVRLRPIMNIEMGLAPGAAGAAAHTPAKVAQLHTARSLPTPRDSINRALRLAAVADDPEVPVVSRPVVYGKAHLAGVRPHHALALIVWAGGVIVGDHGPN
jgi:hypothetical protein